MTVRCSQGHENPDGSMFCDECGERLDQGAQMSAPAAAPVAPPIPTPAPVGRSCGSGGRHANEDRRGVG